MDERQEAALAGHEIEWIEGEEALLAAVSELKAMILRQGDRSGAPVQAAKAA